MKVDDVKWINDNNNNDNIFNSSQTFTFIGDKYGITTFSFSADKNAIYKNSIPEPSCSITFIVCLPGCKKCLYESTNKGNFQYCYQCYDDYALLKIDGNEYGNCYYKTQIPPNYYIVEKEDSSSDSDDEPFYILEQCDKTCFSCEDDPKNCTQCATGYYKRYDSIDNNCFEKKK